MNNGLVVRNVIFINRAPFENLDLQFIEGINVLSSENGRGKTTIMSYIVDALYEIAKETFSHSFDGHNTAFYRISSGEKGLLCIFGEILRQADCIHQNIQVDQIDGLVMVDEIDKHLHIRQQKEALPRLFNNFFNVQFIISSHSPFLNMGLADHGRLACQIIDLDSGGVVCEPRHNELYNQVYEMMLQEKAGFVRSRRFASTTCNND